MEVAEIVRALAALAAVLALLGLGLWAVRRSGGFIPGAGHSRAARLAVSERIALDQKRSLALVRHGNAEHLLLLAPEGVQYIGRDDHACEAPFIVDLNACRVLSSTVPMPPAPVGPLWPGLPAIRRSPIRKPQQDPVPVRPV